MVNYTIIMLILSGAASVAPLAVYLEEQKALQNIATETKIKDWDFATATFYVETCKKYKSHSTTCDDAVKALDDYQNGRGDVKILGY